MRSRADLGVDYTEDYHTEEASCVFVFTGRHRGTKTKFFLDNGAQLYIK